MCEELVPSSASGYNDWGWGEPGRGEADWHTRTGNIEVEVGNPATAGDMLALGPSESFGTWADHGGLRGINQGHVDALRAVLWTDDLGQALRPRLAQQLTCKTRRRATNYDNALYIWHNSFLIVMSDLCAYCIYLNPFFLWLHTAQLFTQLPEILQLQGGNILFDSSRDRIFYQDLPYI